MLGIVLGLGSAAAFGVSWIVTRRGVLRASSNYIATLTVFTGPIFFAIVAIITGDLFRLSQFSWGFYLYMALSGVVHFALGRTWTYRSIQLIGATRSNIVISLNPIVTVILGMIVLRETVTPVMAVGIVFTLMSPLAVLVNEPVASGDALSKVKTSGKELDRPTLYKGFFYGIGGSLFWGSSAILIKLGLEDGGSPIVGSLIAYLSASIVILPFSFLNRGYREEILHGDRNSLRIALFSGLITNITQLMRYIAIGLGLQSLSASCFGRSPSDLLAPSSSTVR
jgi:drug/metabolite transporter (DMT)-like permease